MTKLAEITRENAIEILKSIDGEAFVADNYKGKRVNTLVGLITEKFNAQADEVIGADVIEASENMTYETILSDTIATIENFANGASTKEILEQEKDHYIAYGMNAFDYGYVSAVRKEKPDFTDVPTSDEVERESDVEMTTEQEQAVEEAKPKANKKARVMDMDAKEKLATLTPKQKDLLKVMKKVSARDKGIIDRRYFMPIEDKKACYSVGGVLTTLIEKGIVERIDKLTYKFGADFAKLI